MPCNLVDFFFFFLFADEFVHPCSGKTITVSWLRGSESHKYCHGNLIPQINIFIVLLPSSSQQCPDKSIEGSWKSVLFMLPNVVKGLGREFKERVLSGTCVVRVIKTHSKRFSNLLEEQRILTFRRLTSTIVDVPHR